MGTKTHILAIPFPLQGHINPMLQLCNRLSSKGVRVTFVTTVSVSKTLQTKTDSINLINIETVPDLTIQEVDDLDIYEIYIRSFRAAITNGISGIIKKQSDSGFPVKAIVYDSVIPWSLDIANENGLKGAVLFTQPCAVSSIFYHMHKGTMEISLDEGSEVLLPGMPVMGLKDLPTLVYDMNSYPSLLRLLVEQFSTFEKADWRLFNTFDKLEDEMDGCLLQLFKLCKCWRNAGQFAESIREKKNQSISAVTKTLLEGVKCGQKCDDTLDNTFPRSCFSCDFRESLSFVVESYID